MMNSRYRIVAEVGRGQFGQVFCGSDRTTGELVALKNLDHQRFKTRNFLRELAVLLRLNHPNIVSFHALDYNSTGRYIVMDYCQGGTLRQLMESKLDVDLRHKLQIVQDILLGLEHAHQRQVVHCDLKPENILLNVTAKGWIAQIADFGIAHFSEQPEPSDSTGDTGSPAYMAPERFYGKYSPASDLYAMGVILFELVAGKRPFSGMPFEVMNAHFSHPLRIPKPVPMMLKSVIRRALQKLPQNRYGSAAEMRLDIETVVATLEHAESNHQFRDRKVLENEAETLKPATEKVFGASSLTPGPREMELKPHLLQTCLETTDAIIKLWVRSQGCFIAQQTGDGLNLSLLQPDGSNQWIGDLPQANPEQIDLDPSGRFLAVAYLRIDSNVALADDDSKTSILQILKLSDFQRVCQWPIQGQIDHFWFSNRRHLLVSMHSTRHSIQHSIQNGEHPQTLQLWNRRGQCYWSYGFSGRLQAAALSHTQDNCLFAIAPETPAAAFMINLRPFSIKRMPLEVQADWISATRWGYLLVRRTGEMVCLNRRGRIMTQAKLPLSDGEMVTAIATSDVATVWLATQTGSRNILLTLDLAAHLPKSLLKI